MTTLPNAKADSASPAVITPAVTPTSEKHDMAKPAIAPTRDIAR